MPWVTEEKRQRVAGVFADAIEPLIARVRAMGATDAECDHIRRIQAEKAAYVDAILRQVLEG
jgi:hypothetical protein